MRGFVVRGERRIALAHFVVERGKGKMDGQSLQARISSEKALEKAASLNSQQNNTPRKEKWMT
jgi:hypothetical protein